jgi:protease I
MARIAMPLAQGFEDSEFTLPYERMKEAGHEVLLVGETPGEELRGKHGRASARIEATVHGLDVDDFDALVIPGGQSPDRLRANADVVGFVKRFVDTGKPVAAICHGPQLLIEADAVRGRELTSWPSVRKDLQNAGATWVDRELVEDGNLITSRKPEDLDAFCGAIERRLAAVPSRG